MSELVLRGVTGGSGARTSVALPAGTEEGDLIVAQGHNGNDGRGRNRPLPAGAMSDPRMLGHYPHPSGDDWWGRATNLADLQVTISNDNGYLRVATFGASERGLVFRGSIHETREGDAEATIPIEIPALDVSAVVILATEDNGSASTTGGPDFPAFNRAAFGGEMSILWWTGPPSPSPAYSWVDEFTYQEYDRSATILPIGLAPPVRQYPRDDGLGHSSAPRLYPPPKGRRVFGGYT